MFRGKAKKKIIGSITTVFLLLLTGGTLTFHENTNHQFEELKTLIINSELSIEEKNELLGHLDTIEKTKEAYRLFNDDVNDRIEQDDLEKEEIVKEETIKKPDFKNKTLNKSVNIPTYEGETYTTINGNVPFFKSSEMTTQSFEYYSELDELSRPGVAYANISKEIMPTEKRGSIGMVKPAGWHTIRYDQLISGKYLYNRCHLIGYQLAGENANKKNLITGTRALNVDGMLPFENLVDDFVEKTNYHVLYRVTPIYRDNNLVADGVLIEAKSVEDNGKGLQFNVFVYNVQEGVAINYATGASKKGKTTLTPGKIPSNVIQSKNTINTAKPDKSKMKVWVASSGKGTKYHSHEDCPNLKDSVQMTLKEAEMKKYTECKKCY